MNARRVDWPIVAAAVAWGLAEDLLIRGSAPAWLQVATGLVASAALLARRTAPLAVATVVTAVIALRGLTGAQAPAAITPLELLPVVVYGIARYGATPRRAVAGGALATLAMLIVALTLPPFDAASGFGRLFLVTLCAVSWGAGWVVRNRWDEIVIARRDRAELERTADAVLRSAALEQRALISGELQALVGAASRRIAAESDAAAEALDRDPQLADRHLAAAQRATRETVADLRRLLHVLRDDAAETAP